MYAFAGSFFDARFARVGLDFFVVVAEENGARPPPFAVRAILPNCILLSTSDYKVGITSKSQTTSTSVIVIIPRHDCHIQLDFRDFADGLLDSHAPCVAINLYT